MNFSFLALSLVWFAGATPDLPILKNLKSANHLPKSRDISSHSLSSKAPEGHHPRGTNPPRGSPRKFASQRALRGSLRGLCGVSSRVLRGLSEGSAGLCGGPLDFPRLFGG